MMYRAHFINIHVCDGATSNGVPLLATLGERTLAGAKRLRRAPVQGARSAVWLFQISDEQRRNGAVAGFACKRPSPWVEGSALALPVAPSLRVGPRQRLAVAGVKPPQPVRA